MKRIAAFILTLCLLLSCAAPAAKAGLKDYATEVLGYYSGQLTSALFGDDGEKLRTKILSGTLRREDGEPAGSLTVRLFKVSGEDRTEIGATRTDENGYYELVFAPKQIAAGEKLILRMGDDGEGFIPREEVVREEITLPIRSLCVTPEHPAAEFSECATLDEKVSWSDRVFLDDSGEYRQDLAVLSLAVAQASFTAPESDLYWDETGDDVAPLRAGNIRRAHEILGFGVEYPTEYLHYDVSLDDDSDKVAFSVTAKDLLNPDTDRKEHLVMVAVRSGGYGNEWLSNFTIGRPGVSSDAHAGFTIAAGEVAEKVESYIRDTFRDDLPVRLWMMGHSRGGAVTNLAAGMLSEIPGLYDTLFAYTFATPMGTKNGKQVKGLYNIVYNEDPVPRVAPAEWGFTRNGTTLTFDTVTSGLSYEQAEEITATYAELTQNSLVYHPMYNLFGGTVYEMLIGKVVEAIPDSETYVNVFQPYLLPVMVYLFTQNHLPDGTVEKKSIPVGNEYLEAKITKVIPGYGEALDAVIGVLGETSGDPALMSATLAERYPDNELIGAALSDYTLMRDGTTVLSVFKQTKNPEVCRMLIDILTMAHINMMEAGQDYTGSLSGEMTQLLADIIVALFDWPELTDKLPFTLEDVLPKEISCHSPEPYYAWLRTLTAEEMFGLKSTPLSYDYTVTPDTETVK